MVSNQREVSGEILSRAFTEARVRGLVTRGRISSYIATGFPPFLLTSRKTSGPGSVKRASSAAAFRVALETRLKAISTTEGNRTCSAYVGRCLSTGLLASLSFFRGEKCTRGFLKGGYAMGITLTGQRGTTKDIDISTTGRDG